MKPGEILMQKHSQLKALADRHHIREIWVFGSVARGEDKDNSDVDLCVFYNEQGDILTHAAFVAQAQALLGVECDILCDEMLALDSFRSMEQISVPLDDWVQGRRVAAGYVSPEERAAAGADNIAWITSRIGRTIGGMSYEAFADDPIAYDAVAHELTLLASIVQNTDRSAVEAYEKAHHIDLSGCDALSDILLTSIYPRMVYGAARRLAGQ